MVVVGDGAEGQALVEADAPDPELPGPLQHRIGDLLVVDEPAAIEPLGGGAGVSLPGVDLERGRLHVHEVEIGLAELRRDEAVGEHPAGLGDAVDLVPDVGHLLRRHHRLLRIGPGRGRDEPDVRLAVEEHLLDHVRPRQVGQGAAVGGQLRVESPRRPAQPEQPLLRDRAPAPRLLVVRVVSGADVVELQVEDEEGRARARLERRPVGRLDREHVEEPAEDRVHGEERRRHAAARPQESAAALPEPRRQPGRLREDPLLDRPLGGRLGERRELLVGDEPGRQRQLGAKPPAHPGTETEGVAVPGRHDRLLERGWRTADVPADDPV